MKRTVKFKVVAINQADIEVTIFDCSDYKMAEQFATDYVGEHKEVFIKKVFVRPNIALVSDVKRPGSEL